MGAMAKAALLSSPSSSLASPLLRRKDVRRRENGRWGGGRRLQGCQRNAPLLKWFSGNAAAGAGAGVMVSLILHPIDTVKVLVQSASASTDRSLYRVLRRLLINRGPRALYSGLPANLAASAPTSAIYASAYEAAKGAVERLNGGKESWVGHCVGGGMASIATSFLYTPTECIKQKLQVGQFEHGTQALVGVLRAEGVKGLYRGWGAVLCRNVPQSVVKFLTYEQLKRAVRLRRPSRREGGGRGGAHPLSAEENLLCGGLSGCAGALFTTPFDLVKTRLQTQMVGSEVSGGVASTLRAIVREEGVAGLYRGLTPRLVIYMCQGAVFFTSYEILKASLVGGGEGREMEKEGRNSSR